MTVTSTNGGIEEMSFQSTAAVQWLSTAVGPAAISAARSLPRSVSRLVAHRVDRRGSTTMSRPGLTRWSIAAPLTPSAISCRRSTMPSWRVASPPIDRSTPHVPSTAPTMLR